MEKIQSAIAKARAARATKPGVAAGRRQTHREAAPVAATEEAWAELPVFEPTAKQLRKGRIVALAKGREATEFDKLRTRMLQQMQARGWKRVAITSPAPASGKSTITLNLGFSLSRQSSMRTVICEMDLRRPSLARILGIPAPQDFARVIDGSDPFSRHAIRPRENLAIGAARGFVDRSAELLQGPQMSGVLDDIEAEYDPDIMLFDMPPLQVSDDTMGFVDKVDCVLIIAAAEKTTIKDIDIAEREVAARSNVLGIVLNKCRYMGPEQSYDYY